jgi:hypothetical protein
MNKDWKRKDVWKREGKNFMVEVSRHEVRVDDSGCYDSEGPHRWCLYVYVYPKHPVFAQFDASGQMYDQPSFGMHCGNSYFRTWRNEAGAVTSYQVGSDYNHDGDWHFTRMKTPEDAYEVFNDADEIFDALSTQDVQP